ncbi:hypothetical protein OIO90_000354 [Microbotryomycetes sp. JL221]|nr:hypothetical protein OIO90_000354 [Microbotryomycetes sp. JL221]
MAPNPPQVSLLTGESVPEHYIHANGPHFQLSDGRVILLRGINLSSSAKTPQGQPGQKLDGFWQAAKSGQMSFVNRVLDLDDGKVDEHLERLKEWGFNTLRYVVTWESIEHEGPGKYDDEYIAYTINVLRKCKEHGFLVYMDPHQDVWSRFSGGSGAPYWTLIACGLNPENFTATAAAYIQCEWPEPSNPDPSAFPAMIWATNYSRLACQTLFTLWFAGRDFAPKCIINGVNIQDYLQEHYFNAMRQLGNAIRDAGDLLDCCVIGWDSLNEPNAGFIGCSSLSEFSKESVSQLKVGPMSTPFQGMRLGMGEKVELENWKFGPLGPKRDGNVVIDPKGKRAWLDSEAERDGSPYGWVRGPDWELGTCIWGLHGVWDPETSEVLQPDYFAYSQAESSNDGDRSGNKRLKVEFGRDYWLAHWQRFAPVVREFHPEAIHFVHSPVFQVPPDLHQIGPRVAHSTHFYDGLTLITKHWNWFNADALGILRGKYPSVLFGVKVGEAAIRKCLREQLGLLRQDSLSALGQVPTMMGEIGIPYDLDKKKAYTDGDYTNQVRAMDASLNACDGGNVLNYTIWCYCPDNSHQWGDLWNGEDLSVFSNDDARRMTDFRASNDQLDLMGKVPKSRSRAGSRSSSLSSSTYSSRQSSSLQISSIPENSTLKSPPSLVVDTDLRKSPQMTTTVELLSSPTNKVDASSPLKPYRAAASDSSTSLTLGRSIDPYQPISLNDGARAIAAFVRPYPVKTVGTPLDINFDVRSSKFSLTIRIEPNDVSDASLPTEVYVPLVHYAAFPSRISQIIREDMRGLEIDPSLNATDADAKQGQSPTGLSLPNEASEDDPRALALKVKVSTGRWETQGQTLKWYYPRPTQNATIVKLEIERLNGAIPTWVNQWARRDGNASQGDSTDVGQTRSSSIGMFGRVGFGVVGVVGVTALALAGVGIMNR